MIGYLNFSTRGRVLRPWLELCREYFLDTVCRISIRLEPFVEVLGLLPRGMGKDARLSLPSDLSPIYVVHTGFSRANWTFRSEELRSVSSFDV